MLLALTLALGSVGCTSKEPPPLEIAMIEVDHWAFDNPGQQGFRLDFAESTVYHDESFEGNIELKPVGTFNSAAREKFCAEAGKWGLQDWAESYENLDVMDGGGWTMTITYDDGHRQQVKAINVYEEKELPPHYAEISQALKELAGRQVLF
ncbi:MAG: hypothetical protein LBK28_07365 [Propionibacteriaceae bacterium]|jgi:hypothetical protein|nr:hypothetical protein [Propionibacteriaceae bacterium]